MRHWLLAAAAAFLALTAHPVLAQQGELVLYYYSISPAQSAAMNTLIGRFEAENKDIKVRAVIKNYQTLNAEIKVALVAGQPPDVGMIVTQSIADMVENAKAIPFDKDPNTAETMGHFFPTLRRLGDYKGRTYLMPFAHGLALLYYNKDLMKKAGLDPEVPPRKWSDLVAAAKTVQDKTGKFGLFAFGSDSDWNTQTLLIAGGADILDDSGKRFVFDSASGIGAMQAWQDAIVKHKVQPPLASGQSNAAFAGGALGFTVTTSGMLLSLTGEKKPPFELGLTTMPTFGDDPLRVPNSGAGLMVFAQDEARQKRAFKFLSFMSRRENSNFWSMNTGYMPTAAEPMADPEMQAYLTKNPHYGVLIRAMPAIVPKVPYPGDRSADLQNLMTTLLADLIANKGPAATLVPATAKEMNQVLTKSAM
jgi:multiple sugar transport system substrate-binding protein